MVSKKIYFDKGHLTLMQKICVQNIREVGFTQLLNFQPTLTDLFVNRVTLLKEDTDY